MIGSFTGIFDGSNYGISRLYINKGDIDQYTYAHCGFWGVSDFAEIGNLKVYDSFVSCNGRLVGTLVGYSWYTTISSINIEGVVYGESSTGGIIGETGHTYITQSSFVGTLKADYQAGGLVGYLWASVLSESYAEINIDLMDWSVHPWRYQIGGLVGYVEWSTVESSFVIGTVRGVRHLGGVAGTVLTDEGYFPIANIKNCWSDVEVIRVESSTSDAIGSLIGENYKSPITNSYSTGRIIYEDAPDPTDKGFIGEQDTGGNWADKNNFFDMETSLQTSTTGNATGKVTADMKNF